MKIAIIAWGSLVWDPKTIQIKGDWINKGPNLKIEFSRVSKDGRLTLVIDHQNGAEVKTYYAQSIRSNLYDAVADLRDREGTIIKRIGFYNIRDKISSKYKYSDQIDVFQIFHDWCERLGYDSAVWTALLPQFEDQTNMEFSVENAIKYLRSLPKSAKNNALEYIKKAPKAINTPVRKRIEKRNYTL